MRRCAWGGQVVRYPEYLLWLDVGQKSHDQAMSAAQKHMALVGVGLHKALGQVRLCVLRQERTQTCVITTTRGSVSRYNSQLTTHNT